MHRTLLFVYGTLRAGERNHRHLRGAALVGPARTPPKFRLVDLGRYPALLEGGETSVVGEHYRVDDETLAALDELEGHPDLFVRTSIRLLAAPEREDHPRAEAYLLPAERCGACVQLPTGDFRDRPAGAAQGKSRASSAGTLSTTGKRPR